MPPADHTTTNIEKEGNDTALITTKHPYQCLIVMDGPAADQTTTNMGKEGSNTAATTTKETTIEDDSSNEDEDEDAQSEDSSNEDEDAQSEKESCAKTLRATKKIEYNLGSSWIVKGTRRRVT